MQREAVLFLSGGASAEHTIALQSAQNVYPYVEKACFDMQGDAMDVLPVWIAPDGQWYLLGTQHTKNWPGLASLQKEILPSLAQVVLLPLAEALGLGVWQNGQQIGMWRISVIFPMLHGPSGEDGRLQGLAELFGVQIVGSDLSGSVVNMDKVLMKALLKQKEIPCARYRSFCGQNVGNTGKSQFYTDLGAELFALWQCEALYVKPARMGSSIGISQIRKPQALEEAVRLALCHDEKFLIEEGLSALELEFAVIELDNHKNSQGEDCQDNGNLLVSGAAQIQSYGRFYSYEQKYLPEQQPVPLCVEASASLPEATLEHAQKLAAMAFRTLGARHYARVDLFYLEAEDRLLFNELNTLPGFTPNSMFSQLMAGEGWPMERLVPHLLRLAQNQNKEQKIGEITGFKPG